MKKILVIIEKGDDCTFSAYTPETKSTVLNGQGNTEEEAIADFKESLKEVIESYQETDQSIPEELQEPIEFEFERFNEQLDQLGNLMQQSKTGETVSREEIMKKLSND